MGEVCIQNKEKQNFSDKRGVQKHCKIKNFCKKKFRGTYGTNDKAGPLYHKLKVRYYVRNVMLQS